MRPPREPSSTSARERLLRLVVGAGLGFFLASAWGLYDRRAQWIVQAGAATAAAPCDPARPSALLPVRPDLPTAADVAVLTPEPIPESDQRGFERLFTQLPLDLNRASAAHLAMLPGIGPLLADRIAVSRSQHGFFESVDDLNRVKGIGPKRIEKLRPYLTVKSAPPDGSAVRP